MSKNETKTTFSTDAPLLQLQDVKKYFYKNAAGKGKKQCIKAVDGISLDVREGETVGLVGESGCGKSTLGRAILNLNPATAGVIRYKGKEIQGSGCGTALAWLKGYFVGGKSAGLIHSDWVQMLCESGNIGLGIYIVFALVMLLIVLSETWKFKDFLSITFAGALTVASFMACFFAMGFDNVITYAQQGYVIPFIFLGIFYKFKDLNNDFCSNTSI